MMNGLIFKTNHVARSQLTVRSKVSKKEFCLAILFVYGMEQSRTMYFSNFVITITLVKPTASIL